MASVKPFRGLRPTPELVAQVAALPYDVMDSEEAKAITRQNPHSFLRVTKSEVDLAPGTDVHSPQVYAKARENLQMFKTKGYLVQDPQPCFYIYKQQMGQHMQVGLVAAASVDEYQANIIKKHELTRPDKEQDRVDHITATAAQTGAVFLTYRADGALTALLNKGMEKQPIYDFTSEDGIGHTLYLVDDVQEMAAIEAAFAKVPVLYIADGHHRSAAAARVRDERRKKGHLSDEEEVNRFLTVIFPHTMMKIMDYNRVVQDLHGRTPQEFLQAIAASFQVEKVGQDACKPQEAHTFGLYLAGEWYKLTAKQDTFAQADPVASLDVSILQNNLLAPLLGIADPRTDKRIHFVGGIRGMTELERLVDSGKYKVAFALYPTAIEELMAIADAGKIMPPKSTWFEPKLRDAMVIHSIEENK
jgi:uncharacterized protein (DUF1015 family)